MKMKCSWCSYTYMLIQVCSRSNSTTVPITRKGVYAKQWDKAIVNLQHYGMCEHTEGISAIYMINGNVMNFCGGEFNGCVREVHRVGRDCRCRTALLYIRLHMLFLEYPSVWGDGEQLGTHWVLVAILQTAGKLLAFLWAVSVFCPRLVSLGDPAFQNGAVRLIETLNCPQVWVCERVVCVYSCFSPCDCCDKAQYIFSLDNICAVVHKVRCEGGDIPMSWDLCT